MKAFQAKNPKTGSLSVLSMSTKRATTSFLDFLSSIHLNFQFSTSTVQFSILFLRSEKLSSTWATAVVFVANKTCILKPACCDKRSCQYSFLTLGDGSNIIGDIKRDSLATDLIISLASVASTYDTKLVPTLDPSPESQGIKFDPKFFRELPSMDQICKRCKNDAELREFIGVNYFEILRLFILANKAQLMTLPDDMKTSIDLGAYQFLVTSVSPESEIIFRQKKELYGVKLLWHGSWLCRW